MVVIDGEQNFPVDAIAVALEEVARLLRQPGELLGRIAAVEALDEAPDLRLLGDELGGEYAEPVDRASVEISFDQQHRAISTCVESRHGNPHRRLRPHRPALCTGFARLDQAPAKPYQDGQTG